MSSKSPIKLMKAAEASIYLREVWGVRRSAGTLQKIRCIGGGPKFFRFGGMVFYTSGDLDDWVWQKVSKPLASTSDYPHKRSVPHFGRT